MFLHINTEYYNYKNLAYLKDIFTAINLVWSILLSLLSDPFNFKILNITNPHYVKIFGIELDLNQLINPSAFTCQCTHIWTFTYLARLCYRNANFLFYFEWHSSYPLLNFTFMHQLHINLEHMYDAVCDYVDFFKEMLVFLILF